jgi:hypothetical protein
VRASSDSINIRYPLEEVDGAEEAACTCRKHVASRDNVRLFEMTPVNDASFSHSHMSWEVLCDI